MIKKNYEADCYEMTAGGLTVFFDTITSSAPSSELKTCELSRCGINVAFIGAEFEKSFKSHLHKAFEQERIKSAAKVKV
ncbi:hypothetical protein [Neptunicella sp. SCSIO 80796]|uniref:hypothetical protein n=1 Tax=Neptunicella plasticusilytica TaxID=3117012 RepID=UPI003A4E3FAC